MKHSSKIDRYISLLKEYNETTNIYSKSAYDRLGFHIDDSLQLAKLIGNSAQRVYDLGSGSGLPSVIIAMANPANEVVAIESKGRKTQFLKSVKTELNLSNYSVVQSDVNEWIRMDPAKADVVTAKAFKPIDRVIPIAERLLNRKGKLLVPISSAQAKLIANMVTPIDIVSPQDGFFYAVWLHGDSRLETSS